MESPLLKDPLFIPNNYVLLRAGDCIIDCRNPELKIPRIQENVTSYQEFVCTICHCQFLIKSDAIMSKFKCCWYECPAYIYLYKQRYYSYQPWE